MKNAARLLSGLLLASVLLAAAEPIPAYASSDNQGAMDAFPALGVSSDTMNENNGTISTLYGGGTIGDNRGTISSSRGTVYANHGSIESLSAGKVGINYGTINRIENTGLLEINYTDGTVGFVGMGNEVGRNDGTIQVTAGLIGENDGTIQENTGTVNHSYSKVSSNKGTVTMHSGRVGKNEKSGVVLVENNDVSRIDLNEGSVIISSGYVYMQVNTGNIEITNATVDVGENHGNITLGKGAELGCGSNMSSGVITKTDKSADISCTFDYGRFIDETATWYEIVFWGDDGKAAVTECDKEENGVYYTQAGSNVTFTLPPEYECSSGMIWEAGNVNTWIVNAAPEAGSTEFTIFCHICTPGEYRIDTEKHWQVCAGCGKALEAEAHTFDQRSLYKPATCSESALYCMKCETCGALDIFPVGDPAGHSWDAGEVTTPATHEAEGEKTFTCTVCKETKTESIPKLKEEGPIEDFVLRFYAVCLGRDKPDEDEIAHYVWEITDNGMTGSEVAGKFIFSDEFCMKNYCDRHYVEALYKTFMGRVPGDDEVGHWVWQLQQGMTREQVFNSFLSSVEFASFCTEAGIKQGSTIVFEGKGTRAGGRCTADGCKSADGLDRFVKRLYNVTLDREPRQEELDAWVYYLIHGDHTAKTASHEFLFSKEFISRGYDDEVFVDYLYRAMMGREPGADEIAYWVWRFSTGLTREAAFNEFADSDEFALICQSFGINCR